MRSSSIALIRLECFASSAKSQADESRLLRFPAIHGDNLAFTYTGNLYAVSAKGGVARRLTSHDGFEMFARYSPDGKWIAFTGQTDEPLLKGIEVIVEKLKTEEKSCPTCRRIRSGSPILRVEPLLSSESDDVTNRVRGAPTRATTCDSGT